MGGDNKPDTTDLKINIHIMFPFASLVQGFLSQFVNNSDTRWIIWAFVC